MKTSCIIPTFNRKDMVLRAIKSVLAQSVPIHEIIVVDDGSTDQTSKAIAEHFPTVTILVTQQLGPGNARNVGAQNADGDVLFFLDSDDLWHENHIEALLGCHEKGFDVSYGVTKNVWHLGADNELPCFFIPDTFQQHSGWVKRELFKWCFLVPSAFSVTKKAYRQTGGFPQAYPGEDWLFFLRLAESHRFGFTKNVIATRYMHGTNLCCNMDLAKDAQHIWQRVSDEMLASKWATKKDENWAKSHAELIKQDGYKWKSVQDWYLAAMKKNY